MTDHIAYIGVGSNIFPEKNIIKAIQLLKQTCKILNSSNFYQTNPVLNKNNNDYYNGAFQITTKKTPEFLKFNILRKIEDKLGRIREADKYASREIDLDLLLFDDLIIKTNKITIPDTDIYKRPFIAFPLYELSPDLIIPGSKIPIKKIITTMNKNDLNYLKNFTILIKTTIIQ